KPINNRISAKTKLLTSYLVLNAQELILAHNTVNVSVNRDKLAHAFFHFSIINQFDKFRIDSPPTILAMNSKILQALGIGLPVIKASNRGDRLIIKHANIQSLTTLKTLLNEV